MPCSRPCSTQADRSARTAARSGPAFRAPNLRTRARPHRAKCGADGTAGRQGAICPAEFQKCDHANRFAGINRPAGHSICVTIRAGSPQCIALLHCTLNGASTASSKDCRLAIYPVALPAALVRAERRPPAPQRHVDPCRGLARMRRRKRGENAIREPEPDRS